MSDNVLAVTAELKRVSIACRFGGKLFEINENLDASTYLVKLAQDFCEQNRIDLAKIDRIVTTSGPGSFTGIRTAQSFAKGVALALKIPAVCASYFQVIKNLCEQKFGEQRLVGQRLGGQRFGGQRLIGQRLGGQRFGGQKFDEGKFYGEKFGRKNEIIAVIRSEKNQVYFHDFATGNFGVSPYESLEKMLSSKSEKDKPLAPNRPLAGDKIDEILRNTAREFFEIENYRDAKNFLELTEFEPRVAPLYINAQARCKE